MLSLSLFFFALALLLFLLFVRCAALQEMCLAMGQNPSSQRYVPYNATDFKFNDNWQKLVMKPLEQEGVDFWWLE